MTPEQINEFIGVGEYYQAPHALQVIMLNRDKRVELFKKFLAVERDLSYDWFRSYFQLPPLEIQHKIGDALAVFDAPIAELEAHQEQLKKYKKWSMQNMFI